MEPQPFDPEDLASLPDGTDVVVYAKDQPRYLPLPTVAFPGSKGVRVSRWTFTDEERARIAAGEDLYLQSLTFGKPLQPLRPSVGFPDLCSQDL